MTKFSANTLISDVSELDQLLFNQGQQALEKELNDFVEQFETREELLELDTAAKTYVCLTNCEPKLNSLHHLNLTLTRDRVSETQKTLDALLNTVLDTQSQPKKVPFEQEKQAYLMDKEERKRQLALDMTRESDKLDELYAKMTRESIYRNLVGSNHQWFQS